MYYNQPWGHSWSNLSAACTRTEMQSFLRLCTGPNLEVIPKVYIADYILLERILRSLLRYILPITRMNLEVTLKVYIADVPEPILRSFLKDIMLTYQNRSWGHSWGILPGRLHTACSTRCPPLLSRGCHGRWGAPGALLPGTGYRDLLAPLLWGSSPPPTFSGRQGGPVWGPGWTPTWQSQWHWHLQYSETKHTVTLTPRHGETKHTVTLTPTVQWD